MSMTVGQLEETIAEAERFTRKAKELLREKKRLEAKRAEDDGRSWYAYLPSPKITGAVRRASMDLTRSLADLRRA